MEKKISLQQLKYGSYCNYSPRGVSELSKQSQRLCNRVKRNTPPDTYQKASKHLAENSEAGSLHEFLNPESILVPVPSSSPLNEPKSFWSSRDLAKAMVEAGLGKEVVIALERIKAVPKSAFAQHGERPSVQNHVESLKVVTSLPEGASVVLIDDVITKGATLFACGSLLAKSVRRLTLHAFALIRTQGLVDDINKRIDPSVGVIEYRNNLISREP